MNEVDDWEDVPPSRSGSRDVEELARMIESEAGGTPEIAQRGVAHAALNYARSKGRPISEIFQSEPAYAVTRRAASPTSRRVAQEALDGKSEDPTGGAIQWDSPQSYDDPAKADRTLAIRTQKEGKRMLTLPGVPSSVFRFFAKSQGPAEGDDWEDVPAPKAETPPALASEPPDVDLSQGRKERAAANGLTEQQQLEHDVNPEANPTPREAARGFMGLAAGNLGGMAARAIPFIGRAAGGAALPRVASGMAEGLGSGLAQTAVNPPESGRLKDIGLAMLMGGATGYAAGQSPTYDPNHVRDAHEPRTTNEVDAATLQRARQQGTFKDPEYRALPEKDAGTYQLARQAEEGIGQRMETRGETRGKAFGRAEQDVRNALEAQAFGDNGAIPEAIPQEPTRSMRHEYMGPEADAELAARANQPQRQAPMPPPDNSVTQRIQMPVGPGEETTALSDADILSADPATRLPPPSTRTGPVVDRTKPQTPSEILAEQEAFRAKAQDLIMAKLAPKMPPPPPQPRAPEPPAAPAPAPDLGPEPGPAGPTLHYMDPELEQLAGIRARRMSDVAGPLDDASHRRTLEIEKHLGAPQATSEEAQRAGQDAEWLNTKAEHAREIAAKTQHPVAIANAEKLARQAADAMAKAEALAGQVDPSPVSFDDVRKVAKEGNLRIRNRQPGDMATAADEAASGVLGAASRRLDPRPLPTGPDVPPSMYDQHTPRHFGEALDRFAAGEQGDARLGETVYGKKGSIPPEGLSKEEAARRLLAGAGAHDFSDPAGQAPAARIKDIQTQDPEASKPIDRIIQRNTADRRSMSLKNLVPYSWSPLSIAKAIGREAGNIGFHLAPPHIDAQGMAFTSPKGAANQAIPLELQLMMIQNQRRRDQEEQP